MEYKRPRTEVQRDGSIYRWIRYDGRSIYSSRQAYETLEQAEAAAINIASCYSVQFQPKKKGS